MSNFQEFVAQITAIQDRNSLEEFLMAITTEKERSTLAQRLEIVKRLLAGEPQHKIAKDLGVGIATVTRGSKELAQGKFEVLRK